MKKIILAAAFASLVSGAAFAQTTTHGTVVVNTPLPRAMHVLIQPIATRTTQAFTTRSTGPRTSSSATETHPARATTSRGTR